MDLGQRKGCSPSPPTAPQATWVSRVGHRVLKTNQVGNIQGRPPGGRGSVGRGVGDEAGTISWGQRGKSRFLKSHLRVKEGTILYFHRAGHIRGKQAWITSEKDALDLPVNGRFEQSWDGSPARDISEGIAEPAKKVA